MDIYYRYHTNAQLLCDTWEIHKFLYEVAKKYSMYKLCISIIQGQMKENIKRFCLMLLHVILLMTSMYFFRLIQ